MYQEQFGLKKRPFRAKACGADVFVGPQTARIMKSLKNALGPADAVVAVTGVPGVGKSTLVRRALEAIPGDTQIIRIGRMQLGHDEVLEFLLEELDAAEFPKSTIKKINLFRELLANRSAGGARVIVVVEDAVRIGEDALAELESLTAADADQTDGANLVLMGDDTLLQQMAEPALLRLKQRTRLRHAVLPLNASELLGYLKHCFRLAGNEYDVIFAAGCDKALFAHSQGNPRVANNLVESVLTAAAENSVEQIDAALIKSVATEEYGLTADTTIIEPLPSPMPEPEPEATADSAAEAPVNESPLADDGIPDLIQDTLPDLEVLAPGLAAKGLVISPESEPAPEPDAALESEPSHAVEPALESEPAAAPEPASEIEPMQESEPASTTPDAEPAPPPTLDAEPAAGDAPPTAANTSIEDTIPTLFDSTSIPAPEAAPAPEPAPVAESNPEAAPEAGPAPEPAVEPKAVPVPELQLEPEPAEAPVASVSPEPREAPPPLEEGDKPEWERDPTLAQLRPDIEALEQALADFEEPEEEEAEDESLPEIAVKLKDPTLPGVPEITLDTAIENKVSRAQQKIAAGENLANTAEGSENPAAHEAELETTPQPTTLDLPGERSSDEQEKADQQLEKIAADLARAKTLEDVDEQAAETLFGEEFSMLAAQVAANAPDVTDQNETTAEPMPAVAASNDNVAATATAEPLTLEEPQTPLEQEFKEVYGEDALEVSIETTTGGLDLSASQRLATVRALNADKAPAANNGVTPAANAPAPGPAANPEPIEDQINTSMTQTLKALSARPQAIDDDDDDDDDSKSGFFSRFRRS